MKRVLPAMLLLASSTASHAFGWEDLWSRPEQRTIAQRQQAFAEIQGQQFRAAAEHLKPFADPVSEYNRANALARGGDLQGALQAYDQVLKGGAGDAGLRSDAQHNRDLVAKQLQQQQDGKSSGKSGGKPDQSQQQGGKQTSGGGGAKEQAGQERQGAKSGTGDEKSAGKTDRQDGKPGGQQDARQGQGEAGAQDQAGQARQNAQAGKGEDKSGEQAAQQAAQQAAAQAGKQDGVGKDTKDGKSLARTGVEGLGERRAGAADAAPSDAEKAESLDQWLRWIPDDPSGLLRRKFMIEHMLQQRQGQP